MQNNNTVRRRLKVSLGAAFAFSYTLSASVSADSLGLSNTPLQATGSTKPNLMIVLDSSGSMDTKLCHGNGCDTRLEAVQDAASNLLDSISDNSMRVGYATFTYESGAAIRNNIADLTPAWRNSIKNQINWTGADDWTPLSESVMDIGRYFTYGYSGDLTMHPDGSFGRASSMASPSDIFSDGPAFENSQSQPDEVVQYYCQKNFMILLTDGEPTHDRNVTRNLRDYATDCDPSTQYCSNKLNGYGSDGSGYLPDVAAALHDIDLRPDLKDDAGDQVKNNVTSYFVGFAEGSLADNELLKSAGKLGGGGYIYSDNAAELTEAFNQAIGSIANSIGSQSSVSFNSTSLDVGSVIYSAQFDTTDNSGRLFARSMDPDTGRIASTLWDAGEELATLSGSRQIITTLEGQGVPFQSSDVEGDLEDSYTVTATVTHIDGWRDRDIYLYAGNNRLDSARLGNNETTGLQGSVSDISSEIRVLCRDCSNDHSVQVVSATVAGVDRSIGVELEDDWSSYSLGSVEDSGAISYTSHRADLRVNTATNDTDDLWEERLSYVRGNTSRDGQDDFRRRGTFKTGDASGNTKLLGDIVHSTPIYVGKPELSWPQEFGSNNKPYAQFAIDKENRNPMVYVGANDGMLHGFNADSGEEIFAYVPEMVLSPERNKGLHAFTSSSYSHRYYVDLTPTVSDVFIDTNGGNSPDWSTVLVGGLRGGGKGYFALDVTDPSDLASAESKAADIVMWEFDGGNTTDRANLGFSYSEAQIAKMNNGKWAVVFGNGYNSDSGVAGLFVVYLEDGTDGWETGEWEFISTGSGVIGDRKNGLSSPRLIDLNGDRIVDRVYAGDLMGNVWAFDLTSENDNNWGVAHDGSALFSVGNGDPHSAITAAPLVARNTVAPNGTGPNVLVMFGTGQYLNSLDLTETQAGAFYAVWDKGDSGLGVDDLEQRSLVIEGSKRRISSSSDDDINWSEKYGWYMSLAGSSGNYAAERVVSGASLRRNTVFFNTIIPNPQPCASSGTGWLMSLDFRTGLPEVGLDRPVVDFNNDGSIDQDDAGYVGKEFEPSACTGDECENSLPEGTNLGMPGQSGFIGDIRCTPGSAGNVDCDETDPGDEEREGRLAWEELTPTY